VENGHTVPAVETLEKLARAFEMPLYQLLYEGEEPPKPATPLPTGGSEASRWGSSGKDARYLRKLSHLLSKMDAEDRTLLLSMVKKMTQRKASSKRA
jgi:transcriptional regulator with XRE-family HTH domain